MTIDKVNSERIFRTDSQLNQQNQQQAKIQEEQRPVIQDTLELSEQARNLKPIEAKLNEGFYDRPDVIRQVALRMSQELPAEKPE